jgi:uncharacterized protein
MAGRLDLVRSRADEIRAIVERHHGANPRVFGSTARGDDASRSDIDILVDMRPRMSIFSLLDIQDELEALLGTDVDVVVDSPAIPASSRARIEQEALPL